MLTLRPIPIIDNHCYAFPRPTANLDPLILRRGFAATSDPEILAEHLPHTLIYRWTIRQAARLLECAATEEAVLAARAEHDLGEYTGKFLTDAGYGALFVDAALRDGVATTAAFAELTGRPSHPILSLENVAESLAETGLGFDELVDRFTSTVADLRRYHYVGAKSMIACQTGLGIARIPYAEAAAEYRKRLSGDPQQGGRGLANTAVMDYLMWQVFPVLEREEIPLQIQVVYTVTDPPARGIPVRLRQILEPGGLRRVPITLLLNRAYTREAGYLASTHPNVFLAISPAIPGAVSGVERDLAEALDQAPASKLLFASNAHTAPELFWAGAMAFRLALERTLSRLVEFGYITPGEAEEWGWMILYKNTLRLYQVRMRALD